MTKKSRLITPICIAFIIVYIIFATKPLSKEIQLSPEWTLDTEIEAVPDAEEKSKFDFSAAVPFKLGQTLGYVSADGKLLNKISFPYKATVSQNSYAVYGTASDKIDFFAPDGEKIGTIFQTGFPYFTEEKKCIFLPGGSAFEILNDDGSKRWLYEGSTPVIAFSTSKSGVISGFADGNVIAFNNDGEIIQQYKPGGSAHEVIYGAAISDSARYAATLSGQENQRFVVSEKFSKDTGSNSSIVFYKTMNKELNRQVVVKFTRDEKKVYYASADGVGLVNLKSLKDTMIPIKGRVLSMKESDDEREMFILSKENGTYTVSVVEGFGVLAGTFSFEASSACIAAKDGSLFVGRDTKISKIRIAHN